MASANNSNNEREPQYIRITTHGKMSSFVSFALKSLEDNGERPIILHTLPAGHPSIPARPQIEKTPENPNPPDPNDAQVLRKPSEKTSASSAKSIAASALVVPRLLSVVEIIKREWLKLMAERKSPILIGLHQYNFIGTLEELEPPEVIQEKLPGAMSVEERAQQILDALQSGTNVKQKHSPYMRITLSRYENPELEKEGATYQPPDKRKISKSARARAKKRARLTTSKDSTMNHDVTIDNGSAPTPAEGGKKKGKAKDTLNSTFDSLSGDEEDRGMLVD